MDHIACVSRWQSAVATATVRDPATMTPGEINRELDSLAAASEALTTAMIATGRGSWRHSDIREYAKTGDAMSLGYVTLCDRERALHIEIELRYGPGAPHRLPKGFKRRRAV